MSFTNMYYRRTTGTAKSCFVCYKPTTTVLATIDTIDFLYTCPSHLSDRQFASPLGGADGQVGARKMGLSDEEMAKVKAEWDERQKKKQEKEKAKAGEKASDDKEKKDSTENEDTKEISPKSSNSVTPSTSTPPKVTHERYALHRDFFAMRQAEHRKRRQAAQTRDLAPRLPGVPSNP